MRLTALISYHLTASTAALCTCGLCSHSHRPWEILPLLACHDALRLLLQQQPLVLIYGHGMPAPGLETLSCSNTKGKGLQDKQVLPQDSSKEHRTRSAHCGAPLDTPKASLLQQRFKMGIEKLFAILHCCQVLPQSLFGGCFAVFFHVTSSPFPWSVF